jgi:hypothetical protein
MLSGSVDEIHLNRVGEEGRNLGAVAGGNNMMEDSC